MDVDSKSFENFLTPDEDNDDDDDDDNDDDDDDDNNLLTSFPDRHL